MNIVQIRHYLKLTETLSFTQAAKECGVTQPTLTRSIQRLEDQLGGPLLFRDGKDTRLTALGLAVRAEFEAILRSEERIRSIAHHNRNGNLEKLSLGIISTITPMELSPFIKQAMTEIASTEVVIHPVSRTSGIELVLSGTLDGCFVAHEPDANPKLSIIELYEERLLLACGPGHRFAGLRSVHPTKLSGEIYVDRLNCEFREEVAAFLDEHSSVHFLACVPNGKTGCRRWSSGIAASACCPSTRFCPLICS